MLGDNKKELTKEIEQEMQKFDNKESLQYWRTPLKIISRITTSGKYETIGGGTQLNIANELGCEPYYASGERNNLDNRFRNINIDEDIGRKIGPCIIAISGMYYRI